MKKAKFTALLLALAMLTSLCPSALAAEEVRKTDLFTHQVHADVDFADMKATLVDPEPILAEAEAVRALSADAANAKEVDERFSAFLDQYMSVAMSYALLTVRAYVDSSDTASMADLVACTPVYTMLDDAMNRTAQTILTSPCDGVLRAKLDQAQVDKFLGYVALSEEQMALTQQERELVNSAMALNAKEFPSGDKVYSRTDALDAFDAGKLDKAGLEAVLSAFTAEAYAIYTQLLPIRRQLAALKGYSDFPSFIYGETYKRDFTIDQTKEFFAAVRTYLPSVNKALKAKLGGYEPHVTDNIPLADVPALVRPYIYRMSSEMGESLDYMTGHHLCDLADSPTKTGSLSCTIPQVNAPFMMLNPDHDFSDFTTFIHEFGHYNNGYYGANEWCSLSNGPDTSEVHSQGNELLFSHWYPELFPAEGEKIKEYVVQDMLYGILATSMMSEFELSLYSNDPLPSAEELSDACGQLAMAYGLTDDPTDPKWRYRWAGTHHIFDVPCYYMSYPISAAGAFAFWNEAQSDYFSALDKYLAFAALDPSVRFQECFRRAGIGSPLTEAYVKDLAATLTAAFDLKAASDTAYPSAQTVTVNGAPVALPMYALKDANGYLTNYVRLADLSGALKGAPVQAAPAQTEQACTLQTTALPMDGKTHELASIALADGSLYLRLRDLGQAMGVTVDWNAQQGVVLTSKP